MIGSELHSQVDVFVPCYNYGRYLDQCIASILTQKGVDVRILIIDDASSDGTPAIGRRLATLDSRVEFIRHNRNQGHIATYNEGIHWASAKYLLLLSADDALAPGALERAVRIMDHKSDVGMVYGKARIILENDNPAEFEESLSTEECVIRPGEQFLQHCLKTLRNPVPTPTAVVRTAVQRQVGGYRTDFPHSGDFEMWMRLAAYGPLAYVPTVQAYYRRHSKNMNNSYQLEADRRECVKSCRYVAASVDKRFPEASGWLRVGMCRLGEEVYSAAGNAFDRGQMEEVRAWLRFANEISCERVVYGTWWRLQLRRILGPAIWQRVRPILARLLGKSVIPRQLYVPQRGEIWG
jgi:GT2 family glycosyltransferase